MPASTWTATRAWLAGADPWVVHRDATVRRAATDARPARRRSRSCPNQVGVAVMIILAAIGAVATDPAPAIAVVVAAVPAVHRSASRTATRRRCVVPLILVGAGPIAAFLKIYALVPIVLTLRWRAVADHGVAAARDRAVPAVGARTSRSSATCRPSSATQSDGGLSATAIPWLIPIALVALILCGRERAAWLAVPVAVAGDAVVLLDARAPGADADRGALIAVPIPGLRSSWRSSPSPSSDATRASSGSSRPGDRLRRPTAGVHLSGSRPGAARYTRPAMTHVFVAPHPDDVALSCGGLIASLRELGQTVDDPDRLLGRRRVGPADAVPARGARLRLEGAVADHRGVQPLRHRRPTGRPPRSSRPGPPNEDRLEATQADADAAAKRFWQRSSWYRRASIRNESLADQPVIDDVPTQGAVYTDEIVDAAIAGDLMARRRLEDERFAYFAEASIVFLDLPDAVFRGYEGDDELLGMPRADDDAPFELLRQEIVRLEPQKVYLPLGVGGHVDHQLCREVGIRLLQEGRRWVMPGPGLRRDRDVLRGLPVRLVERLPTASTTSGPTRWRPCRRT